MKIDIVNIEDNDVVMIFHCINVMPSYEVGKYCENIIKELKSFFGKTHFALFPVRTGSDWDFTIVRKPSKKN